MHRQCSELECKTQRVARGLCPSHYYHRLKAGTLPPVKTLPSPLDRFLSRIQVTESCWLWNGTKTAAGYGTLYVDGRTVYAHRFSYELWAGPLCKGFEIDHLCRVPACVRPEHLELVTHRENVRRGMAPSAIIARTNLCKRGHALTPDNVYHLGGNRRCATCHKMLARARWARR